jgi:hypothetical protein
MPAGPLSPADSLNQISAALGTPNDSTRWATALSLRFCSGRRDGYCRNPVRDRIETPHIRGTRCATSRWHRPPLGKTREWRATSIQGTASRLLRRAHAVEELSHRPRTLVPHETNSDSTFQVAACCAVQQMQFHCSTVGIGLQHETQRYCPRPDQTCDSLPGIVAPVTRLKNRQASNGTLLS